MKLIAKLSFVVLPFLILALTNVSNLLCATSIGQAAPALVVQEFNGHTFDLATEQGKVTIGYGGT